MDENEEQEKLWGDSRRWQHFAAGTCWAPLIQLTSRAIEFPGVYESTERSWRVGIESKSSVFGRAMSATLGEAQAERQHWKAEGDRDTITTLLAQFNRHLAHEQETQLADMLAHCEQKKLDLELLTSAEDDEAQTAANAPNSATKHRHLPLAGAKEGRNLGLVGAEAASGRAAATVGAAAFATGAAAVSAGAAASATGPAAVSARASASAPGPAAGAAGDVFGGLGRATVAVGVACAAGAAGAASGNGRAAGAASGNGGAAAARSGAVSSLYCRWVQALTPLSMQNRRQWIARLAAQSARAGVESMNTGVLDVEFNSVILANSVGMALQAIVQPGQEMVELRRHTELSLLTASPTVMPHLSAVVLASSWSLQWLPHFVRLRPVLAISLHMRLISNSTQLLIEGVAPLVPWLAPTESDAPQESHPKKQKKTDSAPTFVAHASRFFKSKSAAKNLRRAIAKQNHKKLSTSESAAAAATTPLGAGHAIEIVAHSRFASDLLGDALWLLHHLPGPVRLDLRGMTLKSRSQWMASLVEVSDEWVSQPCCGMAADEISSPSPKLFDLALMATGMRTCRSAQVQTLGPLTCMFR